MTEGTRLRYKDQTHISLNILKHHGFYLVRASASWNTISDRAFHFYYDAPDILRERLEICTDNEDDWKEFLKSCTNAFQDATPFKRSHPDPQKRRQFVKAYFDYLYETEMCGGRAGLVCLKQPNENGEDEIVYGVSGIFQNSERRAADTSHMMQIDEAGARLALREDEWVRNNICCKIDNLSKSMGFSWVFFNLQVSKYPKHGFAHKYFQRLGGMFLYDGIKRGKFSSNTTGIAYTVIDEPKLRDFYVHVGMVEIAHLHCNLDDKPRCSEHIGSKEACDCVYVMYIGYPEKELLKDYLKNLFQKKTLENNNGLDSILPIVPD